MSTKKIQILGSFGSNVEVDSTLTQAGKAADAKATGDAINQVQTSIDEVVGIVGNLDNKYYTESEINSMVAELNATIDSKSNSDHIHDDLYYTETEIDDKLDSMQSEIDSKVDAVDGMGLSTNDYTTAEKDKLAAIEANANFYEHPEHNSHDSGLYKVTVDDSGHVSGATLATKEDIVALGIPGEDTKYDTEISDFEMRISYIEDDFIGVDGKFANLFNDFAEYKEQNNDAIADNASKVQANQQAIENIQNDYLTSTDKTQIQDDIQKVSDKATQNAHAIEILNGESDGSIKQSIDNAFNEFAANVTNDDVVNTYKELIDYAAAHGPEFATLVGEVDTIKTDVGEIEANLSNYQTEVSEQFTEIDTTINDHITDTDNPHEVTKEQLGLENVDNTSDLDKPISYAIQAALDEKADFEHMHEDATTDASGFMSAEDKAQLIDLQDKVGETSVSDQITHAIAEHVNVSGSMVYTQNNEPTDAEDGSIWVDLDAEPQEGSNIVVDSALSKFSSNPIQNRAVKIALDSKADLTTTNAAIQANTSAIAAERTRINELLKLNLEEGSTTGDVELTDIRVGYDGTTYESAGTAVRTQIQNLATALDEKGKFNMEDLEVFSTSNNQSATIYLSDGTVEKSVTIPLPVDDVLSIDSNNPVRNSVIAQEISVINEEIETLKKEGVGGGDSGTIVRLTNQNGTASLTTSYGSAAILMFTFTSTIDDIPTGKGVCKISVNGINKVTMDIPQGLNSIDVSGFLEIGDNNVVVTVTDIYDKSRILNYSINVIKLIIESSFDATVPYTGDIAFKYIAYGAVEKTIHFVIDGTEVGTVVTSLSGKQATRTISAMSHGAHKLEVYSTAEGDLRSPKLVYDIICLDDGATDPIIASACGIESVSQGELISIPYSIYDPTKLACDITLTVYTMDNGEEIVYSTRSITVDRNQQHWNLRKYPVGDVYFRIQYGEMKKTHKITVEENKIKIEAVTNDLELYLTSDARSNNETNPATWTHGDVTTTFENVNWTTTGWIPDENGDSCLRLNGTATAEVQFQPFKDDLRIYGKTIELEFTIRDVNNRDATVISCMSGGIGFEVKPDKAYIKSEGNQVFCNYKDEERVRLSFVVEASSESRLLLMYLNGVLSDAVQYTTTDNFQQATPVNITIGSPYCGVDVYNIRSYSTALPSQSVVNNYIADMVDVVRKTDIFEANDIYDEYGQISFAKAREKNSCMIIIGTLPKQKGDKKSSKIVYYDVEDSNLNFEDNATIDVQGTSSQWYVRKNWKLKFVQEHYIDIDQLPAKVICIKVDYAEATGTHNTQNANFVETLYDEKVPAQLDNPKVRTAIYGKPILLFHQKTESDTPVFYGKANFNYDKGAEGVFGFTDEYDVECWEFKDNTTAGCNFTGNITADNWDDSFEGRYPDGYDNITRLKEMHDWVVSTRGDVAKFKEEFENYFDLHYTLIYYVYTFFALMVDQRAKNLFLTYWGKTGKWYPYFYDNDTCFGINNQGELTLDYWHEDCDQMGNSTVYNGQNSTLWLNFREAYADEIKETYQQLRSDGKITYDMLEDRFIAQGSDKWSESVYNEDSEFKYISMLKSDNDASNLVQLRGSGEEHFRYFIQNRINYCDSKWYAPDYADDYVSLRIYTPVDGAGVPLPNLSVPACADITVTPYSNMYAGVRYKANGTLYQERAEHGVPVIFEAPDEIFNNTETAIYGASQLSSLGDLSPLYCGSVKAAKATKLTELIVGSGVEGYCNEHLWELAIGTNKLLKKLDVRNCPKLESPLALTGCPNIEEIYATGTSITGIDLVDGGILRIAHLPATVTNLTLKNQLYIEEFTLAGYSNIKTLHIENCPAIDTWAILDAATSLERLRLTNVDWEFDDAATLMSLATRGLGGVNEYGYNTDDPHISGKAHIKTLTGAEFAQIEKTFPYLEISYDNLASELIFMTWDGSEELYRMNVINGGDGTDPIANGTITAPARESTAQYDFTYAGWSTKKDDDVYDSKALSNVEANRYVYVAYFKAIRYYNVHFYTGTTKLETKSTAYGSTAYYTGTEPQKTGVSNPEDYEFIGWEPSPSNITGELSCYAQFEFIGSWARALVSGNMRDHYENDRVTTIGHGVFHSCGYLESVSFPNVTTVGAAAFANCSMLSSVNLPVAITLGEGAFNTSRQLTDVVIPAVSSVGQTCFFRCSNYLQIVDLPSATTIGNQAFAECSKLICLVLRNVLGVCTISNKNVLNSTPIASGTGYIYVPRALVTSYATATNWNTYANQFRSLEDYTVDGTATGAIREYAEITSLNATELTFTDANSQTLIPTYKPGVLENGITWRSSDAGVAQVVDGVVTPNGDGTTTITASCGESSVTCTVTVNAGLEYKANILSNVVFNTGYTNDNGVIGGTTSATDTYTNKFDISEYANCSIVVTLLDVKSNPTFNRICYYNTNEVWLSTVTGVKSGNNVTMTSIVPENAMYAVISVNKSSGFSGIDITCDGIQIGHIDYTS